MYLLFYVYDLADKKINQIVMRIESVSSDFVIGILLF